MKVIIDIESWPIKKVFKIAHFSRFFSQTIYCELEKDGVVGIGESFPYSRYDECAESVYDQIFAKKKEIANIKNLDDLQKILPAGAARNAVDSAFWDLQAKLNNQTIWQFAKLPKPKPIESFYTLSIESPEKLRETILENNNKTIFKLKLNGDEYDKSRIITTRETAKNAKIVIDANEAWTPDFYDEIIETCLKADVKLIEQPFKAGEDDYLREIEHKIQICADESCHTSNDLEKLKGKYDIVNIKLDKSGGLTEALKLKEKAKEMGFKIMIGCMVSTSLSIKLAYYLAQDADYADLDGFALLTHDRKNSLILDGSMVSEQNFIKQNVA